jgi:squalene cyclase
MTSWALLALIAAGGAGSKAVQRGAAWLQRNQGPDGRWPDEPIAGVFNRSCAIEYHAYRRIFPVWALAAYAGGNVSIPSLGSPPG